MTYFPPYGQQAHSSSGLTLMGSLTATIHLQSRCHFPYNHPLGSQDLLGPFTHLKSADAKDLDKKQRQE
jgi:hypothetical protein